MFNVAIRRRSAVSEQPLTTVELLATVRSARDAVVQATVRRDMSARRSAEAVLHAAVEAAGAAGIEWERVSEALGLVSAGGSHRRTSLRPNFDAPSL
jgi:hypothetical protein